VKYHITLWIGGQLIINMMEIIGTSHVSPKSVEKVKRTIENLKPSLVAVELDKLRYDSLLKKQTKTRPSLSLIRQLGVSGFVFYLLGSFVENYIGKKTGVIPGDEMLAAIKEARKQGAKIALIDQPVILTLRNISSISFKEKLKIVFDMIFSLINPKHELRKVSLTMANIYDVPNEKDIVKIISIFEKRYPLFYKVLIDDRNRYMVRKLNILRESFEEPIVAVVGAGHVQGMKSLLKS